MTGNIGQVIIEVCIGRTAENSHRKGYDMIAQWLDEIKRTADPNELGMVLVHNGIVRGTSKKGAAVGGMYLTYDAAGLEKLVRGYRRREGIVDIRVWINSGELHVGDDIMLVLVAGRFRTDVLPVFESLIGKIKGEIVSERETGPGIKGE